MKKICLWIGVFASMALTSPAADESIELKTSSPHYDVDLSYDSAFQQGKWEVGVNSGFMMSPMFAAVTHRVVNYTTTGLQGGLMLCNPIGSSWYRGNFELVMEFFGGGVVCGEGSYVAGVVGWIRYNFLPENARFKPYVQLGGGGEVTDIDHHLLGQKENFNTNAGVGFRYLLSQHCSLNVEYRYQHFSDAGMTKVNVGINAHGPVVGVSWFF